MAGRLPGAPPRRARNESGADGYRRPSERE